MCFATGMSSAFFPRSREDRFHGLARGIYLASTASERGRLRRLCRGVPTKWVVGDASPINRAVPVIVMGDTADNYTRNGLYPVKRGI
jgi:hypothetical protein